MREVEIGRATLAAHSFATAMVLADKHADAVAGEISDGWRYLDRTATATYDPVLEWGRALDQAYAALFEQGSALRKVDELNETIGDTDHGGATRAMLERIREGRGDPLLRLVALGHLSHDDLRNASEIARIFEHATACMAPAVMHLPSKPERLDGDVARRVEGSEFYDLLHAFVYGPWARNRPDEASMIVGLAVEGLALSALRRKHGGRWETVLGKVRAGLAEYGRMRSRWSSAAPTSPPSTE